MRTSLIAVIVIAPLIGACASASARTKPGDRPDLVIPPPPPHVIPINAEPVIEPVADVPASPASSTPKPPARPPASRPSAGETKPESKPAEAKPDAPTPETAPPVAPPPAGPPPQLRTTESAAAEAAARASLERTKNLMLTVDYRLLSRVRQKAYDDAKRFAQQAEDALKDGNAMFAQNVANKAETLMKGLASR